MRLLLDWVVIYLSLGILTALVYSMFVPSRDKTVRNFISATLLFPAVWVIGILVALGFFDDIFKN